jgi:hypothetical protein
MPATEAVTNVLSLPLVQVLIETGNNEDWIDSIKFVVDDGTELDVSLMPQLDLRGITFEMEIRRQPGDSEVILGASTDSGTLQVGAPPDFGFLLILIPLAEMQNMTAASYVGDIVGRDNYNTRVAVQIALTIVEGITKKPVNKRIEIVA